MYFTPIPLEITVYLRDFSEKVLSFLSKIFGGFDTLFMTLLAVLVLDYLTAIFRAIYLKKMSSSLCLDGIIKKLLCLVIVIFSVVLENLLAGEVALREITLLFFVANEGLSVLENVTDIIPLPQKLKDILKTILEKTAIIKSKSKENLSYDTEQDGENKQDFDENK
ncbi:MAG: phage holin family protein [Eubacteriales bacterium]|nr:phage holin family protein [Eubacteriales bacterium]